MAYWCITKFYEPKKQRTLNIFQSKLFSSQKRSSSERKQTEPTKFMDRCLNILPGESADIVRNWSTLLRFSFTWSKGRSV